MLRYQWNTLRVGDTVVVHGDEGALVIGTVAFVTPCEEESGEPNSVGVRVVGDDETYYAWPSLADVHSDPMDVAESCVHCRLLHVMEGTEVAAT